MKKRTNITILALVIVFGGLVALNMLHSLMIKSYFSHYEAPAVTISSVEAKSVKWEPKIEAVGNFTAMNGVEVNSEVSGNVTEIQFKSGQYVQKGQNLITIDDRIEQSALKFNKAQLTLEQINFTRQDNLFKKGAAPSSNVDQARANLDQAQANVEKTETQISQKHITAPFTGRLGIRKVNLGQFINPGQTPIVTLQSMDPLYLEFYLPEQLYRKIHIDQSLNFSVDGFAGLKFSGTVSALNSKVDPNTHNILVQAIIPNCPEADIRGRKDTSLVKFKKTASEKSLLVECNSQLNSKEKISRFSFLPGMFANIEVSQPVQKNTVILPSTAVSYSLYGDSVFVIEKDKDDPEKLTVKRIFVHTGEQRGNYTVIKSGIKAGQLVVSSGQLKLQNGTRVKINNSVKLKDYADPDKLGQ